MADSLENHCAMPIYEFACPRCRVVYNFLSKRINPDRLPTCPKCGNRKMTRQMSTFATPQGGRPEPAEGNSAADPLAEGGPGPDPNDPRIARVMGELERDMAHLDENNPKHMAEMMRKLNAVLPPGTMPKEMDVAIRRLAAGEDPEKIDADMGDVLGGFMGEGEGGGSPGSGSYSQDGGLYDY